MLNVYSYGVSLCVVTCLYCNGGNKRVCLVNVVLLFVNSSCDCVSLLVHCHLNLLSSSRFYYSLRWVIQKWGYVNNILMKRC